MFVVLEHYVIYLRIFLVFFFLNYFWAFSSAYLEMEIPKYKTSALWNTNILQIKSMQTHTYKYIYLHTCMCVEYNEGIILEAW